MLLSHLENVSCILGVRIQASVQMQYISKLFSLSKQRRQAKYLLEKSSCFWPKNHKGSGFGQRRPRSWCRNQTPHCNAIHTLRISSARACVVQITVPFLAWLSQKGISTWEESVSRQISSHIPNHWGAPRKGPETSAWRKWTYSNLHSGQMHFWTCKVRTAHVPRELAGWLGSTSSASLLKEEEKWEKSTLFYALAVELLSEKGSKGNQLGLIIKK